MGNLQLASFPRLPTSSFWSLAYHKRSQWGRPGNKATTGNIWALTNMIACWWVCMAVTLFWLGSWGFEFLLCILIWSTEVMFLRLEIDTMLQLHFMVTWVAVYCGRGGRIYLLHFASTLTWVAVYFLFHRDLYFLGVCDLDGTMNSSFNTGPAGYSANSLSTEHATFHTSLDSILEEES